MLIDTSSEKSANLVDSVLHGSGDRDGNEQDGVDVEEPIDREFRLGKEAM